MIGEGILKKGDTLFTPKTLTCPLKRDYFKGKIVFQPLFFCGDSVSFRECSESLIEPSLKSW